jgi:hypothetical protein
MLKPLILVVVLVFFGFTGAYAFEPVPITVSGTMDQVVFDGKWSFEYEWKASSLDTYRYDDDTEIVLRSAHQGDFVYLFLDPITDYNLDKNDHAVICIDTMNDKSSTTDSNDYCFVTYLDAEGSTYRGGDGQTALAKIPNHPEFIAKSTISDANDRYTAIPHPSYEFRIPTDLIGRESVYGFYFLVHDAHSGKNYTYPQNLEAGDFVSSPSRWGEIYSPDKSLPEFGLPAVILFLSVVPILILTRLQNNK